MSPLKDSGGAAALGFARRNEATARRRDKITCARVLFPSSIATAQVLELAAELNSRKPTYALVSHPTVPAHMREYGSLMTAPSIVCK